MSASSNPFSCPHDHCFLSDSHRANERRTWAVIVLTAATMVVEILSGWLFGSMALLADGWHMASHASALGITALAYRLARKHRDNPRFTFGTGKFGDLAGYSSALLLALIAVLMAYESIQRLIYPVAIHYNEAIGVAVAGLAVNIASAVILKEHHEHDHDHEHHHRDHNLRAAYLHVLADALTSILAIVALVAGKFRGWDFMDPVMGIVGAVLITRWSLGLLRDSGRMLLDYNRNEELVREISRALERDGNVTIDDLHVWRLGPGHFSAIVSLTACDGTDPREIKERLSHIRELSHLTVEVCKG